MPAFHRLDPCLSPTDAQTLWDVIRAMPPIEMYVQEAITDSERTNAVIFATSVDGKWGDYDADGL